MTSRTPRDFAEGFVTPALEAASAIAAIASRGVAVESKADESPVTEADRKGEEIILAHLARLWPDVPVVAEESASAGLLPADLGKRFILVDPLDGTKEFINRREDYTVNIALIEEGVPVAGIVVAPARRTAWIGWQDKGANAAFRLRLDEAMAEQGRSPISVRECGKTPAIVASRSHMTPETQQFVDRFSESECVNIGSSLKFCLLAEGACDYYPRFGPTMQWDTAAGDAVLRAAGGMTWKLDGAPLDYGDGTGTAKRFLNPHFVSASASADPVTLGLPG